jgi:hypothetical protein
VYDEMPQLLFFFSLISNLGKNSITLSFLTGKNLWAQIIIGVVLMAGIGGNGRAWVGRIG